MKNGLLLFAIAISWTITAQDLSQGLEVNDLSLHPMQEIAKPGYLQTIQDPSFGTTIRRITDIGEGGVIVPMYSTIQAWNADESLMILYNQSNGKHELLDGMTYLPIRSLDDISPADIEQIFWDHDDPDAFYYPDGQSYEYIKYNVKTKEKTTIVSLKEVSNCSGHISFGNDVQMPSRNSDVITFRCDNSTAYAYKTSTEQLITFDIEEVGYTAPTVAPSGNLFYHRTHVYDTTGQRIIELNEKSTEHSCLGQMTNGNDGHFAIAFAEGPQGGCIGDIIAHDLTTGACIPVISQGQGYDYPQSGTHISALAHKNTEGGWIAASMIGYDKDGNDLLDQELVIAQVDEGNIKVCRIGHHRSDEDEFDYWGEPHPVISPSGTRVLFASDWSGEEDGQSIDSYVVELPAFSDISSSTESLTSSSSIQLFPNPANEWIKILSPDSEVEGQLRIYSLNGSIAKDVSGVKGTTTISLEKLSPGIYFYLWTTDSGDAQKGKFVKI